MSKIEWDNETVLTPTEFTLQQACERKGIVSADAALPRPCVFVPRAVMENIHEHLGADLGREHGGVLVGMPFFDREAGAYFVDIATAIPARDSIGSSVHLQFTAEAWEHITNILAQNYPDLMVVGWYHSHPGLGVFMSATDRASQRAFYNHAWSVALVVDPVSHQMGWFKGPECVSVGADQVVAFEQTNKRPAAEPAISLPFDERLATEKPFIEPSSTKDLSKLFLVSSSVFFLIAAGLIISHWKKRARTD